MILRTGNKKLLVITCIAAILQIFINLSCCIAESADTPFSPEDRLRLGERIYREGILPSGEPMQALVRDDLPTPGTLFSCISCHLRSGLGSFEGGVFTPPTNGNKLFQPFLTLYKGTPHHPKYFPLPPRRPAYTEETLVKAIETGVDPNGRTLNDVMPRYLLDPGDMILLVSYLKTLSNGFSPGVTESNIHFATVVSEDIPPEDRDALISPLQNYFKLKNSQVKYFKTPGSARSKLMAQNMTTSKEFINRTLTLSVWVLKGRPETWRKQLEEYNRTDPAFAMLGGMVSGSWEPVHRFSEDNQIPSLFPFTDLPVISRSDWYTLYLSKGYYQEGEAAARYLNNDPAVTDADILQVVRDSQEGLALAAGFQETWRSLGRKIPMTITLKPGREVSTETITSNSASNKPAVIILWDGPSVLAGLDRLTSIRNGQARYVISAGYLGKEIWTLKEQQRKLTYITYPYRIPRPAADFRPSSMGMGIKSFSADATKIENQTYSLIEILTMALMDMKGNYYRDNFLDVIGMIMDQEVPLYERISFGPGQRYASKGCYIVQLSNDSKPQLIKKSDWVNY
jgi:hypothetical protein